MTRTRSPGEPAGDIGWRERLQANLFSFLLVLLYLLALIFGTFLGPLVGKDLKILLQAEFLVIHAFPFLYVVSLFRAGTGPLFKLSEKNVGLPTWFHWADGWFWILLGLYVAASFSLGWKGPIYFLTAMAATYPGFIRDAWKGGGAQREGMGAEGPGFQERELARIVRLGSRWLTLLFVYLVCILVFDLPSNVDAWRVGSETFAAGLVYFLVLGILEVSGFYSKPFWLKLEKAVGESVERHRKNRP